MKPSKLADVLVGPGYPVRIMGVINVSPESFFKKSIPTSKKSLIKIVRQMEKDGADFIDVGAMSSAPYLKTQISEDEEIKRLEWAVKIISKTTSLPISIDSFRARPAMAGLNAGGKILNDITGLKADPKMLQVAKKAHGLILMANPMTTVGQKNPIATTKKILKQDILHATNAGISPSKIVVDPGIGFFRHAKIPWWKWDITTLKELAELKQLGVPLLVGVSRKSFIGEILNIKNPENRLAGSLAATAWAVLNGASIIRTHDVLATKQVIRILDA
jgi:dihydropteroate synthase